MVWRAKQSGRTPWRVASLRGERSNVPRDNAALYEAEEIGNKSAVFSETRVQQNRQQQYSVFGNKGVALDSGASSVSGGTFESDTRIPIRLGMTFEGGVLAKVIGHFFAKVNGHHGGSKFAITE